jgi:ketopantoate hydroxymethyltransferase
MKSPMTRKPITKGWKRMFKNSELPLGTERARLRTYMKNKMKLTAAQKANYIKRLNNGESFNKIINTINRTTVPKTNFQ